MIHRTLSSLLVSVCMLSVCRIVSAQDGSIQGAADGKLLAATYMSGAAPAEELHPPIILAAAGSSDAGPTPAAEAPASPVLGIAEIVVTARRREESLQTVPIAVTAISADTLRESNVDSTFGVQFLAPSIAVTDGIFGTISIRGLGQAYGGSAPAVVTYQDEVADLGPFSVVPLFDLENVQVLKGPQGTLFGRNTTGGAILYTARRPSDEFGGEVTVRGGDYGLHEFEGALNFPIIPNVLMVRLSGQSKNRDGYTQDLYLNTRMDEVNRQGGRVSVLFKPSSGIENLLITTYVADHTHYSFELTNLTPFSVMTGNPLYASALAFRQFGDSFSPTFDSYLARQQASGPYTNYGNQPAPQNIDTVKVSNKTTVDLGHGLTLKNLVSYADYRTFVSVDFDGTPLDIVHTTQQHNLRATTEEPQLAYDAGPVNAVGGFYFEDVRDAMPINGLQVLGGPGDVPAPAVNQLQITQNTSKSKALYAQGTYKIVEPLSLTGGLRETWDERGTATQPYLNGACQLTVSPCLLEASKSFSALTYTASLEYQFDPQAMVYLTSRKGYKAGGFNVFSPSPDRLTFKPETLYDVELGTKLDWSIGSVLMRTNADIFHDDFKDVQRSITLFVGQNYVSLIANAAKAKIDGLEIEQTIIPIEHLQVSLMYSHINPRFTNYEDPVLGNLTHTDFDFTVRDRANARFAYTLPLANKAGDITLATDASWQSREPITTTNPRHFVESDIAPYGLVNARLEWGNVLGSKVTLGAFVDNLTNKVYQGYSSGSGLQIGFTTWHDGPPRMYGADVRVEF